MGSECRRRIGDSDREGRCRVAKSVDNVVQSLLVQAAPGSPIRRFLPVELRRRWICCTLAAIFSCAFVSVSAAEVRVQVTDTDGRALDDAVVELIPDPAMPGSGALPQGSGVMHQRDLQFSPGVLVVPVGSRVEFPNDDPVLHHVYSFSRAKTFELRLYGNAETPAILFDKPGPVTLGCNIHDHMRAYIYVSDTPYAGRTAAGRIEFDDVPAGNYTARVWHAQLRTPDNLPEENISVQDQEPIDITLVADVYFDRQTGLGKYERGNYD